MQEDPGYKYRLSPSSPCLLPKLALSLNQDDNTWGLSIPNTTCYESDNSYADLDLLQSKTEFLNSVPNGLGEDHHSSTIQNIGITNLHPPVDLTHNHNQSLRNEDASSKPPPKRRKKTNNNTASTSRNSKGNGGAHSCTQCGRTFGFKTNLLTHMRTHTGERPFKCSLCSYSAAHKCNLVTHMNTHTGEKPHKCSYCHQEFRARPNLIVHIRQHTRDLPFKCDKCECSFASQGAMKGHVLRHHSNKTFQCQFCDKKFRQQAHLNTHIGRHNQNNELQNNANHFICEICNESFPTNRDRRRHALTHSISICCKICQIPFETQDQLEIHNLIHCS